MVKDPIPESYWRELAEERRLSLAEALSENEMLHQSIEELREENLNLSQMASQAEYLATTLNSIIGDDEESETEDTEDRDQSDTDTSDVFHKEKKQPSDPVPEKEEEDKDPSDLEDTVPEVQETEPVNTDCNPEVADKDVDTNTDKTDSTKGDH
jgi:hypothetical protein